MLRKLLQFTLIYGVLRFKRRHGLETRKFYDSSNLTYEMYIGKPRVPNYTQRQMKVREKG